MSKQAEVLQQIADSDFDDETKARMACLVLGVEIPS